MFNLQKLTNITKLPKFTHSPNI